MTDVDGELMDSWRFSSLAGHLDRKRPVRLRDKEALGALLRAMTKHCPEGFTIWLDEVEYEYVSVQDLLDAAPPRVTVLHMQARGPRTLVVRLTTWRGGQTWVWAQDEHERVDQEALRRLVGVVEANRKRVGLRILFSKSRYKRIRSLGPAVVIRTGRDQARLNGLTIRIAAFTTVFGFLGGVLGGIFSGLLSGT